jgi:hypothetical protein
MICLDSPGDGVACAWSVPEIFFSHKLPREYSSRFVNMDLGSTKEYEEACMEVCCYLARVDSCMDHGKYDTAVKDLNDARSALGRAFLYCDDPGELLPFAGRMNMAFRFILAKNAANVHARENGSLGFQDLLDISRLLGDGESIPGRAMMEFSRIDIYPKL